MATPSNESGAPEQEAPPTLRAEREAHWAKPSPTLHVGPVDQAAVNRNVEGRRVASPIQGFGKMWQKTYRVPLDGVDASPQEVIAIWKENFPRFWPEKNLFYGPLTGIAPGEVAVINMTMPGRLKLSTGVLVLYADEESFTFMTPQGHMLAGWITFSAHRRAGTTAAQVQVLIRASDPMTELGMIFGASRTEDRFWQHTLGQLAGHLGARSPEVVTEIVCVDGRRQWRNAKNIWHSAAIRSGMYAAGTPFRALAARRRRGGAAARTAEPRS